MTKDETERLLDAVAWGDKAALVELARSSDPGASSRLALALAVAGRLAQQIGDAETVRMVLAGLLPKPPEESDPDEAIRRAVRAPRQKATQQRFLTAKGRAS